MDRKREIMNKRRKPRAKLNEKVEVEERRKRKILRKVKTPATKKKLVKPGIISNPLIK